MPWGLFYRHEPRVVVNDRDGRRLKGGFVLRYDGPRVGNS